MASVAQSVPFTAKIIITAEGHVRDFSSRKDIFELHAVIRMQLHPI